MLVTMGPIYPYLSQVILLIFVDRPFKQTKTEIPFANPEHILYMKSDKILDMYIVQKCKEVLK